MSGPLSLDGFSDELVVTRSDLAGGSPFFLPISMTFLPDNRMLLLSKDGEIRIVDPESGRSEIYMTLTNIDAGQERGLLDITLDPDFANNGYIYLYYTPINPENARIARFQHQENSGGLTSSADLSSEFVVWEDTDGYLACCHYGGGLDFGIDGKIWLTTSDKFQTTTPGEGSSGGADLPVDLTSSSGKIIRVNSDGTIPDGTDGWAANPFIDGAGPMDDSIWAYGLRNPFRARWDEEYGNFYIAEVGGNQQSLAHEDLHIAGLNQAGAFYGWPYYEGTTNTLVNDNSDRNDHPAPDSDPGDAADDDYYSAPIWSLPHNSVGSSMTGGEVYRGDLFPTEWDGVYFYGDYTRDYIRYLVLDETGTQVLGDYDFKPSTELPGDTSEVVTINVGADGALYYGMIVSGEVRRVTFGNNNAPDIINAAFSTTVGDAPLNTQFAATLTDIDGDVLNYTLNFGDGSIVTGSSAAGSAISISNEYSAIGTYFASLTVTDGIATTFSNSFVVEVGDAAINDLPVVSNETIDIAVAETTDSIQFSANLFDADGDALSYTWHFGDGNTASGTAQSGDTVVASHSYAVEGNYTAYVEVNDGEDTVQSGNISVQVGIPTELQISNGLVLLLESDIKIGLEDGDRVVSWLDGSGNGNNLSAQGDPRLVDNATPTGQPAIVFDGVEDILDRNDSTETISGLPAGSANRTMFFVVNYIDDNNVSSGLVYGDNASNQAFGLVTARDDNLEVQGYGVSNDFDSGVNGLTQGWMVQSVVLDNNVIIHYQDGSVIDTAVHSFNTDLERLLIGGEINDKGQSRLEVGAALIYDRAVSEVERQQIEAFLQAKYINGAPDPDN
ncbi:glucose/arabinose dehydrogenase, partial [Labrenzia sp. EL_126]|nr:glucose/arabinose dehydrogenase [Labrenzia sp. EL_126]